MYCQSAACLLILLLSKYAHYAYINLKKYASIAYKFGEKNVAFKKHSNMTGAGLKTWRKALALTQSEAALALGLKLRMFQNYEKQGHSIPRSMALACWALRQGRYDFDGLKVKKTKEPIAVKLAGNDEKLRNKKLKKLRALEDKST